MAEQVESLPEATSEASTGQVQEATTSVPEGTNTETPSETPPEGAQEQPESPEPSEDVGVSDAEAQRRKLQSEIDKAANAARLQARQEFEAELKRKQEEARLQQMDNAEYGEYVRRAQQEQQRQRAIAQQAQMAMVTEMQKAVLAIVSDEKRRAELEQASYSQKFKTLPEFVKAATQMEAEDMAAKEIAKREKTLRKSLANEQKAKEAESGGPVVGAGIPTQPFDQMTTMQKIAFGYAEERKRNKRG